MLQYKDTRNRYIWLEKAGKSVGLGLVFPHTQRTIYSSFHFITKKYRDTKYLANFKVYVWYN